MTKSFMLLLAVFLALGGAFGGVFAGGVAFGKTQGVEIDLPSEANPLRQQLQNQSHLGALTGVIEKVDGNTVTDNTSRANLRPSGRTPRSGDLPRGFCRTCSRECG